MTPAKPSTFPKSGVEVHAVLGIQIGIGRQSPLAGHLFGEQVNGVACKRAPHVERNTHARGGSVHNPRTR